MKLKLLPRIAPILLGLFFFLPSPGNGNPTYVVLRDSLLRAAPRANGAVVGRLPAGSVVALQSSAVNGFYSLVLPTKLKKHPPIWIAASDLGSKKNASPRRAVAGESPAAPATPLFSLASNRFAFFERFSLLNPSSYYRTAGITPHTSVALTSGLSYLVRMNPRFSLQAQVGYSSVSSDFTYSTVRLAVVAGYLLYRTEKFSFTGLGGIGIATSNVQSPPFADPQNLQQLSSIKTSAILSFPILLAVSPEYHFNKAFSALAELGYELNGLGSVGYTRDAAGNVSSASFSASAIFFTLSVAYAFD